MRITKLSDSFGAAVDEFDAARASEPEIAAIKALLYERKVVSLKSQRINRTEYSELARRFGTLEPFRLKNYHDPEYPHILIINNRNRGQAVGARKLGNMWHSDSSYLPDPLPLTFLHAQTVPVAAGDTLFVNMEAAWTDLPGDLREQLVGRHGEHDVRWTYKVKDIDIGESISEIFSRIGATFPASIHPTTVTHPVTHRTALYVNPGYCVGICECGEQESREILARVRGHVLRTDKIFSYRWEAHDILIWDNRSVIHCATELPPEADRLMYRIGVIDGPFFGASPPNDAHADKVNEEYAQ